MQNEYVKYSVSEVMGYLKEKSSLMISEKHADLTYKYGNRHFWCRGYYVDTVISTKNYLLSIGVLAILTYCAIIFMFCNNSDMH